jgi:hypothetical protein
MTIRVKKSRGQKSGEYGSYDIYLNSPGDPPSGWFVWSAIVADDTWHYGCFNLHEAVNQRAFSDSEFQHASGPAHAVNEIKFFYNNFDNVKRGTYGSNPFWIDEFSISPTDRLVTQTQYPETGSDPLQIISVNKRQDAAEVAWEVMLSTEVAGCHTVKDGLSLDFAVDVQIMQNLESAEIKQVQQHSAPLAGEMVLGFGGETVAVSPYASADELQSKLSGLSTLGETKVTQVGTCQTGFGWVVQFSSRPGDQPMIETSLNSAEDRRRASIAAEEIEAGGVRIYPLPADYFQRVAQAPGVDLSVNDAMADCELDANNVSKCLFEFRDDLTPRHAGAQAQVEVGVYDITLSGRGLSSSTGDATIVEVAGVYCSIQSAAASQVVCRISQPFLKAGQHPVSVLVPGNGLSEGTFIFDYSLEVTRVAPSTFDHGLPVVLTVFGVGFDPVSINNVVTVGGISCAPTSVNATQLVCTLAPGSPSRRSGSTSISVGVGLQSVVASNLVTFQPVARPRVTSISPTKGSVGGGDTITISGSNFPTSLSDAKVLLGQTECNVLSVTVSLMKCQTRASSPAAVDVSVHNLATGSTSKPGLGLQTCAWRFNEHDVNSNNQWSEEEFNAYLIAYGSSATFSDADTSQDGIISNKEWITHCARAFKYLLSVSAVTPSRGCGLGGGAKVTVSGEGMIAGSGAAVTATLGIAGMEVYNVGVYQSALIHEIHQIELTGSYVDEIQKLDLDISSATHIRLYFGASATKMIAKSANQYIIQEEINQVLSRGKVQVTRQQNIVTVVFRGGLGNVPILEVFKCQSVEDCTVDTDASVTEEVQGVAPTGVFQLHTAPNRTSAPLSPTATSADVQAALEPLFSGGILVVRTDEPLRTVWAVTYMSFEGSRALPAVLQGSLIGGTITTMRIQQGTSSAQGSFSVAMDGRYGCESSSCPMQAPFCF